MKLNTKRRYKIAVQENDAIFKDEFPLTRLDISIRGDDDAEYIYALQDRMDDVLDLRRGESMYFQPNRDNESTKGIIVRID